MFNREKQKREVILYKILPYASEKEFDTAINKGNMDDTTFELQSRFNYWVAQFEAFYGDITAFWDSMTSKESEKIVLINNLLTNLINNGKETNSTA